MFPTDKGLDEWQSKQVSVSPNAGQVRFVATRGGREIGQPYGDIALDDVRLIDGACPGLKCIILTNIMSNLDSMSM